MIPFAVTVYRSIGIGPGRVCERHLGSKLVGICDDIFIVGSLSDALSCTVELKQILKVDIDMVLDVSKFNLYCPDSSLNLEDVRQ